MRSSRHIGVNGHGEDEFVIFAVEIVKMIAPEVLDVARIDPTMAVGRILDEHHGRKVVKVPVGRDFHEASLLTKLHRFHPLLRRLGVVDLGPCIAGSQPIRLTIMMTEAVIVLNPVVKKQLSTFFAGFPPIRLVLSAKPKSCPP
jgi:hypothetical protein